MNELRSLVFVVLGACLVACAKKVDPAPAGGRSRGPKGASFPVEVMKVDARPHELLISAPGMLDAFERVQVTARVSGVVDKISFAEGQDVKDGQTLALIDSRRYALSVSGAQSALEKAQATAADTEASLKRRQDASEGHPGLIPGEELETYQTKLRTAQADVDQSRESLKLAKLNLEDSNVKAAVAGVIQTRSVETGQYVQAGTVIATLLQRDPLLLRFSVTTAEAPRLKVGTPVDFTLKETQNKYTAKITLVAGAADTESRLVPITAQVDEAKKFWLRPGSFAQVEVKMTSARQFPMIPQTAARPSERGFLAYVVDGDTAHEKSLELGMHTTDGWVEVHNGLSVGDTLVTRGLEALSEGTKVRIEPAGAPAGSASTGAAAAPAGSDAPAASDAPASSGSSKRHASRSAAAPGASSAPAEAP
jgi:multidrug efflux system membrane fusion protein